MKSYDMSNRLRRALLASAAALCLVALTPALASAQTSSAKLTRYLPQTSQLVLGVNVAKLRSSKYFKQALAWAHQSAGNQDILKMLEQDAQVDISKDLQAVVVSIPATNVNAGAPQKHFTVAVSGNFDKAKVIAAIKKKHSDIKQAKHGKATVFSKGNLEFTFPAKGVLWVTAGPDAYRKDAWGAMASAKKSVQANKVFKGLLKDVNTSQGVWLLGDTTKLAASNVKGAHPKSIGLSMDIANGLDLHLMAELPTKKDAKKAVDQIAQLKTKGAQNAMVAMMGAGPLVANLSAKQDGAKIKADTSMTAAQFDTMVQWLEQIARSQMGAGGMTTPAKPVPSKGNGASQGKGAAKADFN